MAWLLNSVSHTDRKSHMDKRKFPLSTRNDARGLLLAMADSELSAAARLLAKERKLGLGESAEPRKSS